VKLPFVLCRRTHIFQTSVARRAKPNPARRATLFDCDAF
jgi:hypothetical protein